VIMKVVDASFKPERRRFEEVICAATWDKITVDTSDETCAPFWFKYGDKIIAAAVSFSYKVFGVAKHSMFGNPPEPVLWIGDEATKMCHPISMNLLEGIWTSYVEEER